MTGAQISLWKRFCKSARQYWWFYFMLLPGLIYIVVFRYAPMYGITIAFKNYSVFKGFDASPWVGFDNFTKLFGRAAFQRALYNNVIIGVEKLIFGFPLPIILSLMLNEVRKNSLKRTIQTAIILPNFISWIVINGLLFAMLGTNNGAIVGVMRFFGYVGEIPNLLADKEHFRAVILLSYLWKSGGYATIIYLAAIAGIDQSLYEAAEIDGAGRLQQLWHITLSSLRPTIVMLLIMRVGEVMNAGFDQIYAISNYLVVSVADIIETYVYTLGMESRKFSEATAAGLFINVIGLTLVLITNHIAKKIDPESGLM
ncbi:MAG: ABC transporter permease subunit [Eubacteriales bacterium]|nr:ABC transporter permease subunit [Eubacteriales bacterium]